MLEYLDLNDAVLRASSLLILGNILEEYDVVHVLMLYNFDRMGHAIFLNLCCRINFQLVLEDVLHLILEKLAHVP